MTGSLPVVTAQRGNRWDASPGLTHLPYED